LDNFCVCLSALIPSVSYLLSPQTSPIGGVGSPSARIVLIGSRSPHSWPTFSKDTDTIILSEIAEFALSLKSTPKGQEPFHGLPHLQAYKLIRASYLVEIGEIQTASRCVEYPYSIPHLRNQTTGIARPSRLR
jgi:hypothetical protein